MDVFNPKILDASIRDVASCFNDTQKVDLLLYALGSIPLPPLPTASQSSSSSSTTAYPPPYTHASGSSARAPTSASTSTTSSPSTSYTSVGYGLSYSYSYNSAGGYAGYTPYSPAHTLLENGIASVLQVRALPALMVAKARVLRARARMRMGGPPRNTYHGNAGAGREEGGEREWVKGVREDLDAALEADPTNKDARALLAALDGERRDARAHLQIDADQADEERGGEEEQRNEEDTEMGMEIVETPLQASRGPTGAEKVCFSFVSTTSISSFFPLWR
ncbi:hypothetical protein D9619_011974 [Psilocybe cf. subviscida]|uniref:Uncharacterized protein n=1 Tax=Psilocybe cf. subviscida TaxID=2480587 RepID=A0A8H5B0K3_9AGAR|nr:hypothetical protein D9619_011974 [Psilocybe cf. subviscida]